MPKIYHNISFLWCFIIARSPSMGESINSKTWQEAYAACKDHGGLQPYSLDVLSEVMQTSSLSQMWINLNTSFSLKWTNRAPTGKVKITHNAGDCGVLQARKVKVLSCNLERITVCERGEASPYCTENKLNWKMAVEYCKTMKGTLFQGNIANLYEAEMSNISCLDDNDGVWLGLRRDAKTDPQGENKDTDCPLTTSHDLEAQCGLVIRRDQLTCSRVPCTQRKPFLCRGIDADGKGYKVFLFLSLAAVVISFVSMAMCGICFHYKKKQLGKTGLKKASSVAPSSDDPHACTENKGPDDSPGLEMRTVHWKTSKQCNERNEEEEIPHVYASIIEDILDYSNCPRPVDGYCVPVSVKK